jgi:hypothetical protein
MPPAFNLSQDQTLQFNPSNNRHKRLFANRFTDLRSLLHSKSSTSLSPKRDFLRLRLKSKYEHQVISHQSAPSEPRSAHRTAKPQAQAPFLRPKPRIPPSLFRPNNTHQAPAAPSTHTYRLYIVKERSVARNTASGKEAGLYSAGRDGQGENAKIPRTAAVIRASSPFIRERAAIQHPCCKDFAKFVHHHAVQVSSDLLAKSHRR